MNTDKTKKIVLSNRKEGVTLQELRSQNRFPNKTDEQVLALIEAVDIFTCISLDIYINTVSNIEMNMKNPSSFINKSKSKAA